MNNFAMDEDRSDTPHKGDVIRTKKMQMEGTVVSIGENRAGYPEVTFKLADGRLMKTPVSNTIVIEQLADEEDDIVMEVDEYGDRVDEVSTEVLSKYKAAAGKDASAADKKGDYKTADKRFNGIVKATKKQFDNDAKKPTTESAIDKVLAEVSAKWAKEKVNELSIGKLQAYKDAASSEELTRKAPLRKVAKHVQGAQQAGHKISTKNGNANSAQAPARGTYESKLAEVLAQQDEAITPWSGYTPDDKKANALAKAPKSSMTGSPKVPFSVMVQDSIKEHGLKWAFNYYVIKNGLPPRHFKIYAGL